MKTSLPPIKKTELRQPQDILSLDLDDLAIYTRYRGHPQLGRADHQRLFQHELISAIETGGICSALNDQHGTVAVCAIKSLDWDTRHFGLPMAKMSLAASPTCLPTVLSSLLRDTLYTAKKKACSLHISCEVDIDDYLCLNALLALGAEILDIKQEYRWASLKNIKPPKFLSLVREYRENDKAQCIQLMSETHFESRFSRDTLLSRKRTDSLYRIWLESLLDRNENDRIALVMERNGRVQACGAIEQHDLNYAGIDIQMMCNGIYISSRQATGSYYPIIYALAERSLIRFNSVQTCVSLNKNPAIRVLERMNAATESRRYALRLSL